MSRRRFLSLLSASAALAMGASSCSKVNRGKVVPYTRKPEEVVPGVATYYASTFPEGLTAHGVILKTREGRPIHVEGSSEHSRFEGRAPLRATADLLGLYDPDRLRQPLVERKAASWTDAMSRVVNELKAAKEAGKPVLLLTPANLSPTRRALVRELEEVLPGLRHVQWEPSATGAEATAAKSVYGEWLREQPRLDRADVVLSLQSDFLGVEGETAAIRGFASKRKVEEPADSMNRLWVLEGGMSLTGANADQRIAVRPSRIAPIAFALARALYEKHGVALPSGVSADLLKDFDLEQLSKEFAIDGALLEALAVDLRRAGRAALVIAGSRLPPEAHVACHLLNAMLGAEGNTVVTEFAPPPDSLATLGEVRALLEEASTGAFGAAILWDANPAYAFPVSALWKSASLKIPFKVRVSLYDDETARDCQVVLPEHHWLEAWGDHEPAADLLSLQQPTLEALHETRQAEDILLEVLRALRGPSDAPPDAMQSYLSYLKARWEKEVYPLASGAFPPSPTPKGTDAEQKGAAPPQRPVSFEEFWNAALHDGVLRREPERRPARQLRSAAVGEAAAWTAGAAKRAAGNLELLLSPGLAVFDGRYAQNGWLQELPDPVTKVTWGNPVAISLADAERLGVEDGDVLKIEMDGRAVEVPAVLQPGQAQGVLSLALGYGRSTGNVAAEIGENAYPLADTSSRAPFLRRGVKLTPSGEHRELSRTQEHHRMDGRDIARAWSLADYGEKDHGHEKTHELHSFLPEREFPGHKWGMAIDLSVCVGCSACVVACQSENNTPVVGPEQVAKGREMHWIRIDRYYEGDPRDPRVVHQPVLCQHCDNAPCETVCPVNATTHSPDGLNQMTYNRCVGTRYCANNCPYKVRRFNFFDYTASKKEPESLAFNPEVSVRPRGVMEKCTFCVQRIQDVRQRAKTEGRPVRDGEIRPACAAACPAEAIVFGDLKDPESAVAKLSSSRRGYVLLEELGAKPAITYLGRVTNPAEKEG